MSDRLDRALPRAIAAGVLPADATRPESDGRPWPVVLLTALGAWLAAIPLLGVVGVLLGPLIGSGIGPYLIGVLVLAGAVVVLRNRNVPLFVEQLAVPFLLLGGGSLGFGLFRDLPFRGAAPVLACVAIAVAVVLSRGWLGVLLGAAAANLLSITLLPKSWFSFSHIDVMAPWLALHGVFAVWLVALVVQRRLVERAEHVKYAVAGESIGAGWLLSSLAGMAWLAGMTFLVGGAMGGGWMAELASDIARGQTERRGVDGAALAMQAASAALAVAAAFVAARAWPGLRQPVLGGVALVLVGLAALMPSLGAVLLALAVTVTTQRWRLASVAAFAAVWIVGAFYYQLHWPLGTKALVLTGAGAVLGALAWLSRRRVSPEAASTTLGATSRFGRAGSLIALTALGTLAAAVTGIWQKEDLIAHGQPVFVELIPVDPRSLMQGDFMRINFRVPDRANEQLTDLVTVRRPHVVAQMDERGVATLLRVANPGEALAPRELRIELTPKNGTWILVTDAWFFKEGEAERWGQAKYGEFRVADDGRALLVGMADAELKPIR
jgi:uncharacterized membrane-anchored protein